MSDFYLAIILDSKSIDLLKSEIKPKHLKTFYHHMTVAYKPLEDIFNKYKKHIGKDIKLNVSKHCFNNKGQAVLIDTDLSENQFPHVTLSCSEGVDPVYSNSLFHEYDICEDVDIKLTGKLEVVSL